MNKLENFLAFSFIGFVLGCFVFLYVATSHNGHKPVFRRFSSDYPHAVLADTVKHDLANDSTLSQKKINHLNELLSR